MIVLFCPAQCSWLYPLRNEPCFREKKGMHFIEFTQDYAIRLEGQGKAVDGKNVIHIKADEESPGASIPSGTVSSLESRVTHLKAADVKDFQLGGLSREPILYISAPVLVADLTIEDASPELMPAAEAYTK